MELKPEVKSEQKSEQNTSTTNDLTIGQQDLKAYRQMTNATSSEKTLPVLFLEKSAEKAPAKSPEEIYKEKELSRVQDYAKKHADGTTIDRTKLTLAALPQDMAVTAKPGQLKLESNDFTRIAEAVPGGYLDPALRTLLGAINSASLDGSKVSIDASTKVPVTVNEHLPKAELTIKNPSFNVVPDATNPNRINLENVNGISIGLLGVGGDLKKVSFTLTHDDKGQKVLQIDIPRPEQKQAQSNDLLSRFGRGLQSVANSTALPETTSIKLQLDNPDTARVVERIFDSVKTYTKAPKKSSPADLAAGVVGVNLKSTLGGMFDDINSISRHGDKLEISRSKASSHDLGGLPIDIAQTVKAKIDNAGNSLGIKDIEGISLNLPVPAEVAKALGLPQPFKANLKEVSIGDPDKDGNRTLTVKTDSPLESVQIKVDKNLKPVTDGKGNISLDLNAKFKGANLPLSVSFNPQQLEKPPATGPDFKISLKGDANCLSLIESIAGTKLESPLKDMVSNVTSISKEGDRISIGRDKSSTHDLGGVILDAGKNIRFKAAQDGPSGINVTNIEGINLKLPVQLPQMVKDLGIDPGNHIYTSLKTFNLSSPDEHGRRRLLLETDHLMKKVGVFLGPDMKPALDPKGNWYMYGFVDNPVANKQLPLVLRFDKDNQLAMSTQELIRIGSQAAWQAKDNGGVEGVGFGMIAVATEAGALALDVKDAVVDSAVYVKDKVVEGASTVGNAISDGASTVGGWVKSGWHYIWD